jgi:lipooligosaccharide transport system ATP-binding protein
MPAPPRCRRYAKGRIKELGLNGKGHVRVNKAGCLDRCEEGPILVVYPEAVWYTYIDRDDIDEIIDRHVVKGEYRRAASDLTPRTTRRATIDGPAGPLEVVFNVPDEAPAGIALVTHPHSQQGGTLDNKVVQTLAKTFFALGYAVVRFNFRGVGASGATFDEGIGETDDALAVLAYAQGSLGAHLPIVLAGFSFGSFVQTRVAQRVNAQRLVLVGPAVRRFAVGPVPADTIVIHGEADDVRPAVRCVRVGTATGAAHRRVSRMRTFFPWPPAPTAARDHRHVATRLTAMAERDRPSPQPSPRARGEGARRAGEATFSFPRTRGEGAGAATNAANRDVVLRVSGLRKRYGAQEVVRGLSFEIRRGDCFGLLGPNGAGKTTTLRCCLGLIDPDGGEIEMVGQPVPKAAREARIRVGVVPQMDNLDPDFTVRENLIIYGGYFGLPRAVLEERIPRLLDFAGLASKRDVGIRTLSGGMKRRLTLARALVNDPELLISRRADDRPRPAGAPSDLGRPAATVVAGQDDPAHHALHGRGRAPRIASCRDRPWHDDRKRFAARAPRTACRARSDRGVRRRGEGLGGSSWPRARAATGARRRDGILLRERCATDAERPRDAGGRAVPASARESRRPFIKLTGRELRE